MFLTLCLLHKTYILKLNTAQLFGRMKLNCVCKTRISKLEFYMKLPVLAGKQKVPSWQGDFSEMASEFGIKLQSKLSKLLLQSKLSKARMRYEHVSGTKKYV